MRKHRWIAVSAFLALGAAAPFAAADGPAPPGIEHELGYLYTFGDDPMQAAGLEPVGARNCSRVWNTCDRALSDRSGARGASREESMDRDTIEKLVERWAAVAAGREEVWDELLAEDVLDLSGPTASRGRESFKARSRAVSAAFGDRSVTVDNLVVDGDRIAWQWTLTGTHVGAFLDLAPTRRRVTLRGANFQRVQDGAVVEHWTLADLAGLGRQLRG